MIELIALGNDRSLVDSTKHTEAREARIGTSLATLAYVRPPTITLPLALPESEAVTIAKRREDLKPIGFAKTIRGLVYEVPDENGEPSTVVTIREETTGTLPSPTYEDRPMLPAPAPIIEDTVMMARSPLDRAAMERPTRRGFPVQRLHSSRPPMPVMVAPIARPPFPTVITRPQKAPSVALAVTVAFTLGVVAASGLAFFILAGHA